MTRVAKKLITIVIVTAVLGVAALFCLLTFRVSNVTVNGNTYYTADEIKSFILPDNDEKYAILKNNSLYLWFKYRGKKITDVPFIEEINVAVTNYNSINISVYEKSLVAYVKYMGGYLAFDREGTVIESLKEAPGGLFEITGLSFKQLSLYEALPVEDMQVFDDILEISLNLNSVGLDIDAINVAYSGYALQIRDVMVYLDGMDSLKAKMNRIKSAFDTGALEGKSGYATLRVGNNGDWEMVFTKRK